MIIIIKLCKHFGSPLKPCLYIVCEVFLFCLFLFSCFCFVFCLFKKKRRHLIISLFHNSGAQHVFRTRSAASWRGGTVCGSAAFESQFSTAVADQRWDTLLGGCVMSPCPWCAPFTPHLSCTGCRCRETFQRGCEEIRQRRLSGWERVACQDADGLKLNARPTSSSTHTNTHAHKRDNCLWFNKSIQFEKPHLFHPP